MNGLLKCTVLFCSLFFSGLTAHAEANVDNPNQPNVAATDEALQSMTVTMRDAGYTIGDTLDMVATFTLPENLSIDKESLPLVGRVKHWLDIQSLDMQQDKQQVTIQIKWQLFATVEMAQQIKTPEIVLKTTGKKPLEVIIPQQAFYYSPVLPMPPIKDIERRPDLTPPNFDERPALMKFAACLGLLLTLGLAWLWLKDLLPGLPSAPGPMTLLSRQLKPKSTHFTADELRHIHTALNSSAGMSLYPNNLTQLFSAAPYFDGEQEAVTAFFDASWAQFYRQQEEATEAVDVSNHLGWIKRVAMAERLFRRQPKRKSNAQLNFQSNLQQTVKL